MEVIVNKIIDAAKELNLDVSFERKDCDIVIRSSETDEELFLLEIKEGTNNNYAILFNVPGDVSWFHYYTLSCNKSDDVTTACNEIAEEYLLHYNHTLAGKLNSYCRNKNVSTATFNKRQKAFLKYWKEQFKEEV